MPIDMSTWIVGKAQTTPDQYLAASTLAFDHANKRGKTPPFNYGAAVAQYRGWIYAAVWMNAKAVATTPLRLYMKTGKGEQLYNSRSIRANKAKRRYMMGDMKRAPSRYVVQKATEWGGEFEEVTEPHPITQLLEKPNPYMLGQEFSCIRSMMAALTGNFYMTPVVETAKYRQETLNRIKTLWVMPSQWVKVQPGEPNEEDFIKGYWYGIDSARAKFFQRDEVFHMRFPNPSSGLYGLGQVEAGWDAQQLHIAQRQTDFAHYANHSRPDVAVVTKSMSNGANLATMKELQEEWARLFRGTFRQGAPVFLTGDTQVIPLNYQPTDIGDREIIIEEIAAVTGVPVTLLKANDPNLASARVGFASWREQTILPYCRMDEEFLNNALLPAFGLEGEAFLCYDDPVPENRDEVQAEITVAMQYGTQTRNEVRQMQGYDPVEDENADTLLVPSGLQPIDKVGELPALGSFSIGGSSGSSRNGGDDKPDGEKPAEKSFPATTGGDVSSNRDSAQRRNLDIHYQSQEIYSLHKANAEDTARDEESEKLIRGLQLAVGKVFAQQRRMCNDALYGRKTGDTSILARVLAQVFKTTPELAEAVRPYMDKILESGGKAGFEQINLPASTFDVMNPKVAAFLRAYSIKLAGEVNQYTAERLSETLAQGLERGDSIGSLSGRVNDLYSDFEGYRTEAIARTESARAYCAGTEQAWHDSEVVQGKAWLLAPGGCPICRTIARMFNETTPVPLNEPFLPLGATIPLEDGKAFTVDYMPIMGPPSHPNCRCSTRPVMRKGQA